MLKVGIGRGGMVLKVGTGGDGKVGIGGDGKALPGRAVDAHIIGAGPAVMLTLGVKVGRSGIGREVGIGGIGRTLRGRALSAAIIGRGIVLGGALTL